MHRSPNGFFILLILLLGSVLSSCESNTQTEDTGTNGEPNVGDGILSDPSAGQSSDPEDLSSAEVLTVSGSDLTVAFTTPKTKESVTPDYVSSQWEHMQGCLGIRVAAPVIIVLSGWLPAGEPVDDALLSFCLLYTSPSPRDGLLSRMPSSA